MRHPSEYTTAPFGSFRVMEVDAGTVITDERTGQSHTVDEGSFVIKGSVIFTTQDGFEALKRATS